MFNFFKTYLQTFQWFTRVDRRPLHVLSDQAQRREMHTVAHDLHYKDVENAFLITEYDEEGVEQPIAVAFVRSKGDGMVIVYLSDLSELE